MNGSIRDNILTGAEYDELWYNTIIRACVLDIDMRQWPEGDSTIIGSKGIKLSGGQKQRIVSIPARQPSDPELTSLTVCCSSAVFSS